MPAPRRCRAATTRCSAPPASSKRSTPAPAKAGPRVGTVGLLEVKPGSPNVVPGEVFFTIDLRHPEPAALDHMESDIAAAAEAA